MWGLLWSILWTFVSADQDVFSGGDSGEWNLPAGADLSTATVTMCGGGGGGMVGGGGAGACFVDYPLSWVPKLPHR